MRVRSSWGKFREFLPILPSLSFSYTTRGQIYSTYIYTVFLYTSHCWAPNDLAMVRWICNVRLKECISTDSLLEKFGINNIQILRYLRWFGHAAKNDGCINSITALEADDHRGGGRPK